jgi:hypothetical protein
MPSQRPEALSRITISNGSYYPFGKNSFMTAPHNHGNTKNRQKKVYAATFSSFDELDLYLPSMQ